jgi:cellulose synthase (UDP-forming)
MFDLFLPKRLGFKVTPKGLTSHRRIFDWRSSLSLLAATLVTIAAIGKGLWEFWYFGIERDAYFFNLSWAGINLVMLLVGLSMAWERPQQRGEERVAKPLVCHWHAGARRFEGLTEDISLSGCSIVMLSTEPIPDSFLLTIHARTPMVFQARLVYHERLPGGRIRCGAAFETPTDSHRRWLVLNLFADPSTWAKAHHTHVRNPVMMAGHLFMGLWRATRPTLTRRRRVLRRPCFMPVRISLGAGWRWALIRDQSARGLGLLVLGKPADCHSVLRLDQPAGEFELVYSRRAWLWIWRIGFRGIAAPVDTSVLISSTEQAGYHSA